MKNILQHLATALLVGITLVQAAPAPQGPTAADLTSYLNSGANALEAATAEGITAINNAGGAAVAAFQNGVAEFFGAAGN
ncbi:hypothetical protein BDQ17DRAFT_1433251 [Cyathus striatus]|nr:hypothetical protein BDQ17DRAFT_1433251 [Cyathus striatus]